MGHGVLEAVDDPGLKARMLQALMEKYQPEGGHAHLVEEPAPYHKELKAVRVFGVRLRQVTGKCNLGQDRPAPRTMSAVRGLYRRGAAGDVEAIETILEMSPAARPTEWRWENAGATPYSLVVWPSSELAWQHAQMLVGQYWRVHSSPEEMRAAILASQAWVGLVDDDGQLLAAARATTDQVWVATLSDVVVHSAGRGRGLGTTLMQALLDHPAVRGCRYQRLGTSDAAHFYARLGFVSADMHAGASPTQWMVRRPGAEQS
jgi:GNAT superfamily N-acetyltransferase